MGRTIYFTDKEISHIRNSIVYYMNLMGDENEPRNIVAEELEDGLGSALYKLYSGCNGRDMYAKYSRKHNKYTDPQQCGQCEGKAE